MPARGMNVAGDLEAAALRLVGKAAIVSADGIHAVSYQQLQQAVERISAFLDQRGVRPGDRVAILQSNSWEHIASWYAIVRIGGVCVDLNVAASSEQWARMLDDCSPRGVLVDDSRLTAAAAAIVATTDGVQLWLVTDAVNQQVATPPFYDAAATDIALIAYTSGTTGLPKGVMHSHGGVRAEIDLLIETCGYEEHWTSYVAIPLFSMHGYLPQVAVVCTVGGTVIVAGKFDPHEFAAASHRHKIAYTTLASPMLPSLCALPADERPDLRGIKTMSCGGAPLHPDARAELERALGVHLTQGYGLTEILGAFVMDIDGTAPYGASGRVYPAGFHDTLRIQDDEGAPLPRGEAGEIAFHRTRATVGYWPDQPAIPAGSSWFPTGDIGKLDDDGYLYLLDRKKDVILRGGFTIYSAEIERVLMEDPAVTEATVIGVPDERVGEVPVAYVVLDEKTDEAGQASRLKAVVRQRLGGLKALDWVVLTQFEELPRNALRKVIKADLRASHVSTAFARIDPAHSTEFVRQKGLA
jgi:acyl-CoA synthetase (AMP-forming)/AMP-acid ligase II